MEKVFVQTTELKNLIDQQVDFVVDGGGGWINFRIRALRPGRTRQVKLWKILHFFRKHDFDHHATLKVHVMIQNEFSGMEISGKQLIDFPRIVIKWEQVGDGSYLPCLEAIPEEKIDIWLRLKLLKCMRNKYWNKRPRVRIGRLAEEKWARTSSHEEEDERSKAVGVLMEMKNPSTNEEEEDELTKLKEVNKAAWEEEEEEEEEEIKKLKEAAKAAGILEMKNLSSEEEEEEEEEEGILMKRKYDEVIKLPTQISRSINNTEEEEEDVKQKDVSKAVVLEATGRDHDKGTSIQKVYKFPRLPAMEINVFFLTFGFLFLSVLLASIVLHLSTH